MKFVVDRFEGNIAVVELQSGEIIDCPKSLLPDGCKEGDIICISIDENTTKEKKKMLTDKMNQLFKD